MAVNVTVLATVVLLLPMLYLALVSPAFLLVRLDIPEVAYLLRTMFSGYFFALTILGAVAATLDAAGGRVFAALFIGFVTLCAVAGRRALMPRLDGLLAETRAGRADVAPRLRRLHVAGMLANALQLAAVIALVPSLVAAT